MIELPEALNLSRQINSPDKTPHHRTIFHN